MYKFSLAFRYMQSRKVIFFSVVGIAFGVMTIIVVNAIMGGFSRDLRDRIRGTSSHITISSGSYGRFLQRYPEVIAAIRKVPHVVGAAPRLEQMALVGENNAPVTLIGIDPAREQEIGDFRRYLLDGKQPSFDEPLLPESDVAGCIVGCEVFGPYFSQDPTFYERGMVKVFTTARLDRRVPVPLQGSFRIVGRFQTEMIEYDSGVIYVPLESLQKFLRVPADTATKIGVALDDYACASEVAEDLRRVIGAYGPFFLQTWEEEKRNLLRAVAIERSLNVILLFLILIVAGFSVLAILSMMVQEKYRDIGVLRALGATATGITCLFVTQGFIVGLLGGGLGYLMGYLLVTDLDAIVELVYQRTGWHPFPPEVYMLKTIPTEIQPDLWLQIAAAGVVVGVLFSFFPAFRAARLDPVKSLRYE